VAKWIAVDGVDFFNIRSDAARHYMLRRPHRCATFTFTILVENSRRVRRLLRAAHVDSTGARETPCHPQTPRYRRPTRKEIVKYGA